MSLSYNLALLNTARRSTAEATGALGYMDYSEVKRFATVYDLQQQFNRLQAEMGFGKSLSDAYAKALEKP